MWMSVPRVTCALVACVPTHRDPTPAPDVRLATECHKTVRGVKVNSISSCSPHSLKTVRTVTTIKDLLNTQLWAVCQSHIKTSLLCNGIPSTYYSVFIVMSMHVCAGVPVFCPDVDECQSLSTCANGICLNSEGSYTCENCPTGYRVSYDGELCEG